MKVRRMGPVLCECFPGKLVFPTLAWQVYPPRADWCVRGGGLDLLSNDFVFLLLFLFLFLFVCFMRSKRQCCRERSGNSRSKPISDTWHIAVPMRRQPIPYPTYLGGGGGS